jgi:O-antigen/teichoic acid export membrane protein
VKSERLGRKTLGGLTWQLLSTVVQVLLQLLVIAILSRLLPPRAFGVVAASLVAVRFTTLFVEGGIAAAVVQAPEIDQRHVRAGLTFQVLVGIVLWGVLALLAPQVAELLRTQEVSSVLPVIAFGFVVQSFTLGDALMQRKLRFRALAVLELFSYAVGYGGIAVLLALRGFGVWAIVFGQLGQNALRTVGLWIVEPHAMRPLWDWSALRGLLVYGGGQTLSAFGNYAGRQGDNFVVARWLGPTDLGLYNRAYQMMSMPAHLLGSALSNVLFPAMASVQHQPVRLRRAYLRGVTLVAIGALSVSVIAAVVSRELVLLLLGEQWLALRSAFQVMVFGMLFRTGYKLSDSLARATGAVYRRAWRQIVYALLVVTGAYIGVPWGIGGVAIGVVLAVVVNYLLMAQLSLRLLDARWKDLLLAHLPAIVVAGAIGLATWPIATLLRSVDAGPASILLGTLASAAGMGLALGRLAPHVPGGAPLARALADVLGMLEDSPMGRAATALLGTSYRVPAHAGSRLGSGRTVTLPED